MKKNIKQFIPFVIAVILVLIYIFQVLITSIYYLEYDETFSFSLLVSVLYAILGLIITLILIILNKNYWKYVFLVLILISFTGLVEFSNHTIWIKFGSLGIEMTALVLLIFHLATNPDIISKIIQKFEPNEESLRKNEEQKKLQFENSVYRFERNFKTKQKSELERIVNENKLMPEAVEAARRLLKNE